MPFPTTRLCLGESTADLGAALAGREAGLEVLLGGLLDLLIGLGEDELDVAGLGHVGVDTTVGSGWVLIQDYQNM